MGLFDVLFRPRQVNEAKQAHEYFKTLTAYKPHFTTWNGELYESELVRSAIDARARNISKLKVEIVGTAQPKLQTQLKLQPNRFQTWSQFLYRLSTILDMENTAVITPIYNDMMETVGYYPLLPRKCEIVDVNGVPWLRYEFRDGQRASEPVENCAIMTKFQYKSDFFGERNDALDPTMKLINIQNQGIEEAVKNGASIRFIAKLNNFALPEDVQREAKRFSENNLQSEDAGILLFPNTYTDIRQVDSKPYTVSEAEQTSIKNSVFNYFGVNEDIIQSRAYGDAWNAFYESVIEQFAIQFSETMTKAMFTDKERAQGSFLMATSNRLQYMSTSDKLNVSAQMADRGVLSLNEVREIWNLPPVDGGDVRIIRGEYYNSTTKLVEGVNEDDQDK